MSKKRRKKRTPQPESHLEEAFATYWARNYPRAPIREFHFHPTRQFRMDFAWPRNKVAVEIQGMGPGHCGILGMTKDYDRHLEALLLNWQIVYLTSNHLNTSRIHAVCNKIALLIDCPQAIKKVPTKYIPMRKR